MKSSNFSVQDSWSDLSKVFLKYLSNAGIIARLSVFIIIKDSIHLGVLGRVVGVVFVIKIFNKVSGIVNSSKFIVFDGAKSEVNSHSSFSLGKSVKYVFNSSAELNSVS